MMIKTIAFRGLVVCMLGVPALSPSASAQTLYGAASGDDSPLYIIQPLTGESTAVGSIGFGVGALAVHPSTGVLYGVTAEASASTLRSLIRVDRSTGAGTLIGPIGLVDGIADIAFRADGTLFAWSENTDDLITININTGAGTVVGNAGVSTRGSGLAFDSSGTLYLAGNNANGALRTVDTATGLTTIVATLNGAPAPENLPIPAMKFWPGTNVLYAVNRTAIGATTATSRLITINPTTGLITVIGSTVARLDALAWSTYKRGDFDNDGKADLTVFRPGDPRLSGGWFTLRSSTSTRSIVSWGAYTDVPVPDDYDGDGRIDFAVYRPSSGRYHPRGTWFIWQSSTSTRSSVAWGSETGIDVPVPGDYDGDGKTDVAVFRPSDGTWYIFQSSTLTLLSLAWGASTDIPVHGDYDSDGKADIAVYRPGTGTWYIVQSSTSTVVVVGWGESGTDLPVIGDYDGDGRTDIAVYRASTGTWYVLASTAGSSAVTWGNSGDVPVPADYDGDGKTDIAVYRPSYGTWYILQSSTSTLSAVAWGSSTDIPILKRP